MESKKSNEFHATPVTHEDSVSTAYKKCAAGERQKRRRAEAASARASSRRRAKPAGAVEERQATNVVDVVGDSPGYTVQEAARAQLEQIQPLAPIGRFLQTWNPETRQLVFGCGDGHRGVLVHSSGDIEPTTSGTVPTRLSPATVQRFLDKSGQVNGGDLFVRLKSLLRDFVHFEDERLYTLVTLWAMGTYCFSIFSHYGYLFFHSILPRSGKTRTLEMFSHLAFEATTPLNAPTPASIREMAVEGRTLQLDTLERWREKSTESFSAAMDLLDAGFRNGGTVTKMVPKQNDGWRRESFLVYAPYGMAAINKESLTDTALDRSFVIEMHRKSVRVRKRKYTYFSCEEKCKPIRNDLYIWALQSAERVATLYETPELEASVNELGLNDRAADIWKPLLGIAQVLELDARTLSGLSRLASEMCGDPEAVEDERKLLLVLALWSRKDDSGKVKGTTEDFLDFLEQNDITTNGLSLHALLTSWGFKQKSIRLAEHGGEPRRAWELSGSKLAAIEKQLICGLETTPREKVTTLTTVASPTTVASNPRKASARPSSFRPSLTTEDEG
jgi:hypothetical protein